MKFGLVEFGYVGYDFVDEIIFDVFFWVYLIVVVCIFFDMVDWLICCVGEDFV